MLNRRTFLRYGGMAAAAFYADAFATQPSYPAFQQIIRRGASRKIAILGAGLAGLVAGYELSKAGHEVTILEAQLRPGGRVHTLREPFSDGMYAEAGAGRIPSTHLITRKYVKDFGLKLEPFWPDKLADVYYLRGERVKVPRGSNPDMAKIPLQLSREERSLENFAALEDKYIGKAMREAGEVAPEEYPPERLKAYDQTTIAEFLRQQGASADVTRFLLQGFEDDSALDFFRDNWSHSFPLSKIIGGNDLLPRAFATKLAANIRYGAQVIRIENSSNAAKVIFKQAGAHQVLSADQIICAIPFSVLRHIELPADFSSAKRAAIQQMNYGAVTRVYLQSRRKFWEDDGCNGYATPDLPMEIWSPTFSQPGRRGIIMSYIYEDLARTVGAMTPQGRIDDFLELTEKIFPGMRENFEGGTSYSWEQDPFQRGAFSLFKRGELLRFLPAAKQPEGRIHFAGEHTSPWPGWMQGALHSGLRAAQEVNGAT